MITVLYVGIAQAGDTHLGHLDLDDDTVLGVLGDSLSSMQQIISAFAIGNQQSRIVRKYIQKMQCARTNIQAAGSGLEQVDDFCYVGNYISYIGFGSCIKRCQGAQWKCSSSIW